jgi:hypothetical protein
MDRKKFARLKARTGKVFSRLFCSILVRLLKKIWSFENPAAIFVPVL